MSSSAVITADIVNSTKLAGADAKKLMKNIEVILQPYKHEFFRGDSFQVYVKSPSDALWLLLCLRATALKIKPEAADTSTDIRASIGIGNVKLPVRSLRTATDEAFVLSGRSFDTIKTKGRLTIVSNEKNAMVNLGLDILAQFLDYLFHRLTAKQAAVVLELLLKRTQVETAKRLKKSQATVHKHIQSAGWPQIEKLLKDYQSFIELM